MQKQRSWNWMPRVGALVQFTDNFHILHGNEEPELYLQFCMIFCERIWNNLNLNHVTKRKLLLKMCSGAVKQADLFLCLNDSRTRRLLDKGTRSSLTTWRLNEGHVVDNCSKRYVWLTDWNAFWVWCIQQLLSATNDPPYHQSFQQY